MYKWYGCIVHYMHCACPLHALNDSKELSHAILSYLGNKKYLKIEGNLKIVVY